MLKLSGYSKQPSDDLTTEVDEYVPVRFNIGISPESIDQLYYWRSTDEFSLMEVRIDGASGRLLGIDVVLVPPKLVRIVRSINAITTAYDIRDEGVPIFELAPWIEKVGMQESSSNISRRRIDEKVEFELLFAQDGVGVIFSGCRQPSRLTFGRASFLFDSDDIFCGFFLEGLDKRDYKRLAGFAGPSYQPKP